MDAEEDKREMEEKRRALQMTLCHASSYHTTRTPTFRGITRPPRTSQRRYCEAGGTNGFRCRRRRSAPSSLSLCHLTSPAPTRIHRLIRAKCLLSSPCRPAQETTGASAPSPPPAALRACLAKRAKSARLPPDQYLSQTILS
jgi:hypothetical protein